MLTVPTFQTVFRETAGLVVDGSDLPRCNAVLTHLYRLQLTEQSSPPAPPPHHPPPATSPITRGLEETITHFTRLGQHLDPGAQLAIYRPLDRSSASDTEARFPDLVLRLARTFTVRLPDAPEPDGRSGTPSKHPVGVRDLRGTTHSCVRSR